LTTRCVLRDRQVLGVRSLAAEASCMDGGKHAGSVPWYVSTARVLPVHAFTQQSAFVCHTFA
jgi:hypothetical protein